jgi:hypothetical protein
VKSVESVEETERHIFRSLFKLALVAVVVGFIARFVASKKQEYTGLTVSEAKAKVEEKLAPRLGDDTASDVADSVVAKLKERGMLVEDPISEAVDDLAAGAEEFTEQISDAADEVKDKTEDAAGKLKDKAKDAAEKLKDA